jgi:hypothetical protein
LIFDHVAGPRVLAVIERASAVLPAFLGVEESIARFHNDDRQSGTELGELLREECGRDAAANDTDVGLDAGH